MSLPRTILHAVNTSLRPAGVQLVKGHGSDPAVREYISARRTIADAQRAGMTVCDYVDSRNAQPGATAATVEAMLELGGLNEPVDRVCEIGPGTGRYTELVIAALHPRVYEVYETAQDWLPGLRNIATVAVRPCDGRTLAATATASVDLVHAQKVFSYLQFMTTIGYLEEMVRVTRPGGVAAFDVVTANCLDEVTLSAWKTRGTFYTITPRSWLIEFLDRMGMTLQGSLLVPMSGGKTDFLVFRKN